MYQNPQASDAIIEPVTEALPALEAVVAQTAESLPADDLEDALADLIAELEDFTDNLDPAGDEVPSATEVSPAPEGVAGEAAYSQS